MDGLRKATQDLVYGSVSSVLFECLFSGNCNTRRPAGVEGHTVCSISPPQAATKKPRLGKETPLAGQALPQKAASRKGTPQQAHLLPGQRKRRLDRRRRAHGTHRRISFPKLGGAAVSSYTLPSSCHRPVLVLPRRQVEPLGIEARRCCEMIVKRTVESVAQSDRDVKTRNLPILRKNLTIPDGHVMMRA
jgi:hypothetical protein